MAGKRTQLPLSFSYGKQSELLTIRTNGKKAHFNCSDAKLYADLLDAVHTSTGYFNVYLTTYPKIAVHIDGSEEKLAECKDWLLERVGNVLLTYHVAQS